MDREPHRGRLAARPALETAGPRSQPGSPPLPPWLEGALTRFPALRRHPHPALAHFAIVFILATTCFSLLYLLTGNPAFEDTAFYCLGGAVLSLPPTIATGLFSHWLNFYGQQEHSIRLEKLLSYLLLSLSAAAWTWRWLNPRVLIDLGGINCLYLMIILALTPIATLNSYIGGMITFPLDKKDLPATEEQRLDR